MRVAALVPTLDRPDELLEMAGTLARQTRRPELLVVVDASAPSDIEARLRALLEPAGIELRYARSEAGTSHQRNAGLDLIRPDDADVVFLFDDDVLLEPDYVERSLECFDLPYDPPVGGVLGTYSSPPRRRGWQQHWFRLFGMTHQVEGNEARLGRAGGVQWLIAPDRVVRVPVASGGRVAYRREVFDEERFDEFVTGYAMNEDVEFSFRVARRWTIVQTPHARLFHKHSPAGRVDHADRMARIVYGQFHFFRKHRPKDLPHLAAFAWNSLGTALFYGAAGAVRGPREGAATLRGLVRGYARCARDVLKR